MGSSPTSPKQFATASPRTGEDMPEGRVNDWREFEGEEHAFLGGGGGLWGCFELIFFLILKEGILGIMK